MEQSPKRISTGRSMSGEEGLGIENRSRVVIRKGVELGLVIAVAALLVLSPAFGVAASDSEGGQEFVERFDQDGDGSVSQDEFAGPEEHFSDLDSNGDGAIDADEAPAGPPEGEGAADRFNRDDQDGDGRVSESEFSGPAEHFSDIDQNQDGYIDSDENPQGPPGGGGGNARSQGQGPPSGGGRGPRN